MLLDVSARLTIYRTAFDTGSGTVVVPDGRTARVTQSSTRGDLTVPRLEPGRPAPRRG